MQSLEIQIKYLEKLPDQIQKNAGVGSPAPDPVQVTD